MSLLQVVIRGGIWETIVYVAGVVSGIIGTMWIASNTVKRVAEERSVGRAKVKEIEATLINHIARINELERMAAMSAADKERVKELREDVAKMRSLIYDLTASTYRNNHDE